MGIRWTRCCALAIQEPSRSCTRTNFSILRWCAADEISYTSAGPVLSRWQTLSCYYYYVPEKETYVMFNNLQICTCHTFVTPDRRPIKLYEIGRGGQRPRGLGGLPMQIEKTGLLWHRESFAYRESSPMARFYVRRSIRRSVLNRGPIGGTYRERLHWDARGATDNKKKTRDASRASAWYSAIPSLSRNRKRSTWDWIPMPNDAAYLNSLSFIQSAFVFHDRSALDRDVRNIVAGRKCISNFTSAFTSRNDEFDKMKRFINIGDPNLSLIGLFFFVS